MHCAAVQTPRRAATIPITQIGITSANILPSLDNNGSSSQKIHRGLFDVQAAGPVVDNNGSCSLLPGVAFTGSSLNLGASSDGPTPSGVTPGVLRSRSLARGGDGVRRRHLVAATRWGEPYSSTASIPTTLNTQWQRMTISSMQPSMRGLSCFCGRRQQNSLAMIRGLSSTLDGPTGTCQCGRYFLVAFGV